MLRADWRSPLERVAEVVGDGGRVFLVGSGTSGRLAAAEAAELPPTFGIPDTVFVPFIASGPTGGPAAVTSREDDSDAAPHALTLAGCDRHDAVLGLAASGTTPFVLAAVEHGARVGAWTCGVANNAGSALLTSSDLGVFLDTGPEILTGSTRLKAGTAQKLALNRITTAAMVALGRVVSNLMVEVKPTNEKLRARCVSIVSELADCDPATASDLLEQADWNVRVAVHDTLEMSSDRVRSR